MPEEENSGPEAPQQPSAETAFPEPVEGNAVGDVADPDDPAQVAAALREQLAAAASRYREAVLAAAPEVPPELVQGGTIEEVDRSLEAARRTVEEVRRRLAAQAAAQRVPAGAPVRGGPELGGLSALEKIKWALSRQT